MPDADFVIAARWTVPVVPRTVALENHALAIRGGRIVRLGPRSEIVTDYPDAELQEFPRHVLLPGFINAHGHAAMTLLRGFADDLPLDTWLQEHIWPAEFRWASEEWVRDGTELAIAEMLLGGTTCFNDMYFFPGVVAATAAEFGIRAIVGMIMLDAPTPYAQTMEDYLHQGISVLDQYREHPRITAAFAPHAPYTVGDESLSRIAALAEELDVPVHMHVHETFAEVQEAVENDGNRPMHRLDGLGLVNHRLAAVHATQLEAAEIALMASRGASVIHCPESNMKLASGICPVQQLLDAGVNVALGTDGAASNNDLDMFGEMRSAALLGKISAADPRHLDAETVLQMATINGARALGLARQTGSLERGKWADCICVDLDSPATQPVHHPLAQLVYSACRQQVTDVWVGGHRRVQDSRLLDMNLTATLTRAAAWHERLTDSDD